MKKILIGHSEGWKGYLDTSVLYPKSYEEIKNKWGAGNGSFSHNSGNLLFISAITQYLTQDGIICDEFGKDTDVSQYDKIVVPEANLFSVRNIEIMKERSKKFRNYGKPVYIIGIGLQAGLDESIKDLASKIEKPVYEYVDSVYKSGGELGLCGHYTKELLDIIYPGNSACVIGCPSMYANGRDLTVSNEKVDKSCFLYAINGKARDMATRFYKYNNKLYKHGYIDQDEYGDLIYNDWITKPEASEIEDIIQRYTIEGLDELFSGNVELYFDIPVWKEEMKRYSFSFGRRIHGNIVSILSGVPALLNNQDKRTEEIANYFDIPTTQFRFDKEYDIYDMYLRTDYTQFNKRFCERYDAFESFLRNCGIVESIADSSEFKNKLIKNGSWVKHEIDYKRIKDILSIDN